MNTWQQAYTTLFGKAFRSAEEVASWDEEIAKGVPGGLRAGEVLAAVRALSSMREEDEATGRVRRFAPTVEDIIRAIKKNRYGEYAASRHPQTVCAICSDGWVSYRLERTPDGRYRDGTGTAFEIRPSAGQHARGERESCPCLCSRGQQHLRRMQGQHPGNERTTQAWCQEVNRVVVAAAAEAAQGVTA